MLQDLTIRAKLIASLVTLGLIAMLIGAAGFWALSNGNDATKTIYNDRLIALSQLDEVIRLIQTNQIAVSRAANEAPEQIAKSVAEVEANRAKATQVWGEYMATFLTEEEKVLAKSFEQKRAIFLEKALNPTIAALKAGDLNSVKVLVTHELADLFHPVRLAMDQLVKLQTTVAKQEFDASQNAFVRFTWLTAAALLLAFLIVVGMGWWLMASIVRPINEAVSIAETVAAGDLTRAIICDSNDELGNLLQALKKMNDSLLQIVGQVRSGTETIATASSQIAAGNLELSSRTEEQASSLEQTAASMEEITSTVKQNADNSKQAHVLSGTASEVAERGGEVVSQVVVTMQSINESSKRIVDIISVIDGIAFQTNILALNAAVEAARAGEQGRGFAVVASEVRSLAQRSAAAAKEIKELINDSVHKVDAGSRLVHQAGATMDEVVESVRRVSDIVAEITAASTEQSTGIDQINQAIIQMDGVTQQNASLVEQAAAAAEAMQNQAATLSELVSVFKVGGNTAFSARPVLR
ncbi:methyl-accepting chemotaxis protein [Undibacterium fentianense]|uniref:Tar ligand binding domain-containing protein n=1 Tax=Undibacterium fentianense TaxID=2828728 RepID=A0A941E1R3_9BURK|nr:methyl-accepting chemotaxis protein [Undibacterium fentianense]MBR7799791.1 Tar ligand binding domain-containing protein [Undibacterium fentianense]